MVLCTVTTAWFGLEAENIMNTPARDVMPTQFRTVRGVSIRYADSGGTHDNTLLLTSPWPESLYAFLPIWPPLSEPAHLLAIARPGLGQSARRLALFSPQAMGEFLTHLVEEGGLDTPHLVAPD